MPPVNHTFIAPKSKWIQISVHVERQVSHLLSGQHQSSLDQLLFRYICNLAKFYSLYQNLANPNRRQKPQPKHVMLSISFISNHLVKDHLQWVQVLLLQILTTLDRPVNNACRCCFSCNCTILLINKPLISRHHKGR